MLAVVEGRVFLGLLFLIKDSKGTLRCDLMIFVGKSTRYPDVDPWFISTTGFRFPDTYRKAARKALRRLRVIYRHHLQWTPIKKLSR